MLNLFCRAALISCCWIPTFTLAQENFPEKVAEVEGVSEYRLANGCRLVLIPDPAASSLTVNMTVLVGSRHEGYGETGMAHLLEHMLFKGTAAHPDIDKELKQRGALDTNGTTDYDRTNYYETLPASPENLEWTIAMEADRLVNCFIRGEDLVSEMTVVRSEFEQGENSPEAILFQRLMANAYEWHNYGKSVIGNRADIERVPIQRLRAFYEKYYRPDNVILFVAGNFAVDQAIAAAAKHFGALPVPKIPLEPTYTSEPTQDGERIVYLNRVGDVPVVAAGFHIPSASHADYAALEILEQVLGDEPRGLLYQDLVKTKKATSTYTVVMAGFDPGMFTCFAKAEPGTDLETTRLALIESIESVNDAGLTEEDIARSVKELANLYEEAQTDTARLSQELSDWAAYGDWRMFFVHRDRLEQVKLADVLRVSQTYFQSSNRTTAFFVPTEKPNRVAIPERPELGALLQDYRGREAMTAGETFEPTPENIAARIVRGQLPGGIKYALLPKQVRGEKFHLKLTLRFGSEATLKEPRLQKACELLGAAFQLGTDRYSEAELADVLTELKAELSVDSEPGEVTFTLSGRKNQFDEALEVLAEVIRHPTFPDEEFSLLKSELRSEIESLKSDPEYLAQSELARRLSPFPVDSLHYVPTIEENLQRLEMVTVDDIRNLYKKFLSASNGELTVVGSFDKDLAIENLAEALAGWTSSVPYARIATPFVDVKPESIVLETPDKENSIYLAGTNLAIQSDDPDWEALYIACDILGGGSLASRLAVRIREEQGLSYAVGCQFTAEALDRSAYFMTYAITNPSNRDKLVKSIDEVFDQALATGVTEEELNDARTSYLKSLTENLSDVESLTATLHGYQEAGRDETFLTRRQKNMQALTTESVNVALQKLLNSKKLVVITAGDFKKAEKGKH
jgi:zinc protease